MAGSQRKKGIDLKANPLSEMPAGGGEKCQQPSCASWIESGLSASYKLLIFSNPATRLENQPVPGIAGFMAYSTSRMTDSLHLSHLNPSTAGNSFPAGTEAASLIGVLHFGQRGGSVVVSMMPSIECPNPHPSQKGPPVNFKRHQG